MQNYRKQINKKKIIPSYLLIIAMMFSVLFPEISFGTSRDRENPVVRTVEKVSPAVVNIGTEVSVRTRANPFSRFGMDPFFDSFFRDFFDPNQTRQREYKRASLGSGVIIDGDRGFILTNYHVIEKTDSIKVVLKDEREFDALIVGADPDSDLSVLRIESKERLPAVSMGNSDDIMIGETVIAIGNPFGFSNTVTTGVISAENRNIRTEDRVYHDFIQTDASINPGNSGGPLLNIEGELIGINTAIYAKAQGIGFAIPINKAKRIVSDLIKYGEVVPAWIGITPQNLTQQLARYLNVPDAAKGVLVASIEKKGPAYRAGVREGDLIGAIGNKKLGSIEDYDGIMKDIAEGDVIKLNIIREGKNKTIKLKASVFPEELASELAYRLMGILVEDVSRKNIYRYRLSAEQGVVITELDANSYLAGIRAEPGDVIRQIGEIVVNDSKDFKKAVVKYRRKGYVVILLQRGDQGYYITVRLG